jgi:hypothetical protein
LREHIHVIFGQKLARQRLGESNYKLWLRNSRLLRGLLINHLCIFDQKLRVENSINISFDFILIFISVFAVLLELSKIISLDQKMPLIPINYQAVDFFFSLLWHWVSKSILAGVIKSMHERFPVLQIKFGHC